MKDFLSFTSKILDDENLSLSPFYREADEIYSYQRTIETAQKLAANLILMPETFFALQIDSPYKVFTHLLAFIMARKKILILSPKEPQASMMNYKKKIGFEKIIHTDTLKESTPIAPSDIDMDDPLFAVLSSGSTGESKAIFLSLNNIWSSSESVINYFQMNQSHVSFLNLPVHHVGGLMILWRAFFSHGSVSVAESHSFDFISLVPLQLQRALNNDEGMLLKLKKAKAVLIGGAALSSELRKKAESSGLRIFETYGMSETSSLVMLNGKALPSQEIKLDNEGYFLIKGPTVSPLVKKDDEGFFHTKDLGVKNSDGSFSFLKRGDLLFKSAGEMINPLEIEAVIKELPWVQAAVIVPLDHPEWTQASCLVLQLSDSEKGIEDIKGHLRTHLHPYQIPKYFYEDPGHLFMPGMKPKRFEIKRWAQKKFYGEMFHVQYEDSGHERLMVFFHGFMEDLSDLAPLKDSHHRANYLFIDLPGHGRTKTSAFKSRDEVFFHLKKMIEFYQGDSSLIFYGYSMGGRVALELSVDLDLELLILESASFGLLTMEEKDLRLLSDRKLFSGIKDLNAFFRAWYKNPIFGNYIASENYTQEIQKKLERQNQNEALIQDEWQKSLEFFSPGKTPHLFSETMDKLTDKKIIGIVGLLDMRYTEHYDLAKKYLENLVVFEIKGAGHNPHKTHLELIKEILGSKIN